MAVSQTMPVRNHCQSAVYLLHEPPDLHRAMTPAVDSSSSEPAGSGDGLHFFNLLRQAA